MESHLMKFWAHSDVSGRPVSDPGARWQLLATHLRETGALCEELARLAQPSDAPFHQMARAAGLLHDFGKYQDDFQRRLEGAKIRCQHSIHGATLAWSRAQSAEACLAIAGHHAGMPDSGDFNSKSKEAREVADGLWRAATEIEDVGRSKKVNDPQFSGKSQAISPAPSR